MGVQTAVWLASSQWRLGMLRGTLQGPERPPPQQRTGQQPPNKPRLEPRSSNGPGTPEFLPGYLKVRTRFLTQRRCRRRKNYISQDASRRRQVLDYISHNARTRVFARDRARAGTSPPHPTPGRRRCAEGQSQRAEGGGARAALPWKPERPSGNGAPAAQKWAGREEGPEPELRANQTRCVSLTTGRASPSFPAPCGRAGSELATRRRASGGRGPGASRGSLLCLTRNGDAQDGPKTEAGPGAARTPGSVIARGHTSCPREGPAVSAQESQVTFLDKQVTDEPLNKGGDNSWDERGSLHPTAVLRGREWGLNSRAREPGAGAGGTSLGTRKSPPNGPSPRLLAWKGAGPEAPRRAAP
ncbi:unnamed protein product [Rangifer tarandus platyrhynchus]|uniref:Uncharacterized protein n=1 Tax=Rangifer tarandus platyrhynchus TaxID=3082113 RepID=A0AC59YSB7_RANTA